MSKITKALNKARMEKESALESKEEYFVTHQPQQAAHKEVHTFRKITKVQEPRKKHLEANRVMSGFIDQRLLDTYNLLRTQILHKTREQRWNAIMVTSAVPGEGKTTLAVNLGLSIASEAMQTALVVDMNLRSPKVDTLLDLQCQHGLSDYLLDGAELSDLLVNPNHDNFVVLPAGKTVEGSTDILGSVRMKELVQELKHRYPDRYVIFDCPHILDMPDALIFASYVDAVMLVVEAGKTSHDHVQKALEMLNDNNVIGLVLNKIITG